MAGSRKWTFILAVVLCTGLLFSACKSNPSHGLKEQKKDRYSYSLGYQTGQNLKSQRVDVDLDTYLAGVRDALAGKKSELTQDEIRRALSELGNSIRAAQQADSKAKAEKNLAEGRAFLEGNRNKEGVQVRPSGLQYRIIKQGSGRIPKEGDVVTVNYRGALTNGIEFASSYRQNKPWSGGLTRAIPGWKEALQLMREGSQWQLFIPADLAYGQKGTTGIEPNSTLVFQVELISVTPALASSH